MKKLGASVATSAIAITALWASLGDSTPASSSPPGPVVVAAGPGPRACDFTPGQTMAFRIDNTVVARDAQGHVQPETDRFAAVLSSEVRDLEADRATLVSAFSDVALRQTLAAPSERVAQPVTDAFAFDVAPDCRVLGFRFPRHWSEATRRLVTSIVSARDVAVATGATWTTEQTDGVGPYVAGYTRQGPVVRRTKQFYAQDDFASFGMELAIVAATTEATFGVSGLERVTGTERIRISVGGALRADLEQSYRHLRDDGAFRRPGPAPALLAADAFGPEEGTRHLPPVPADLVSARALYAQLVEGLATLHIEDAYALAALATEHPALLRALADRLHRDEDDDEARSAVFWILEIVGTEDARAALVTWLDGDDRRDRMRAAIALAGAGEASLETATMLAAFAADDADDVASASGLMAMGRLALRGDEEVRAFVGDHLRGSLDEATTPQQRIGAIDAMANAADPTFLDPLREHLGSDDPRVRRHAARALGRLGADGRSDLIEGLAQEDDARTAAWMAASLRDLGPPQAHEVPWASSQLEVGAEGARAELIRWLGAAKTPEANAALAHQFRVESSTKLRRLIGTFLPASALRGS
ncbi:MAG: HEAT repeat domain-containing protein [Myxococcota bacterium]